MREDVITSDSLSAASRTFTMIGWGVYQSKTATNQIASKIIMKAKKTNWRKEGKQIKMKTIIRPITYLSENTALIEEYAVQNNTPVYITKDGASHLVVMSHEYFEKLQEELALFKRIVTAEAENRTGELINIDDLAKGIDNIVAVKLD